MTAIKTANRYSVFENMSEEEREAILARIEGGNQEDLMQEAAANEVEEEGRGKDAEEDQGQARRGHAKTTGRAAARQKYKAAQDLVNAALSDYEGYQQQGRQRNNRRGIISDSRAPSSRMSGPGGRGGRGSSMNRGGKHAAPPAEATRGRGNSRGTTAPRGSTVPRGRGSLIPRPGLSSQARLQATDDSEFVMINGKKVWQADWYCDG